MDRNEFIARLKENGIPPEIVSFDSSTNDGYNIRKNKLRWETFIRERGEEYGMHWISFGKRCIAAYV